MNTYRYLRITLLLATVAIVSACGHSSKSSGNIATYTVKLSNLSHNQPLSPLALLVHHRNFSAWQIGSEASEGLERLAEGGDNSMFLVETRGGPKPEGFSGTSVIGPGEHSEIDVVGLSNQQMRLTVASMLVNTNDAFAGGNALDVSTLEVDKTLHAYLSIYDAGTEANSELAGTIPGPADGGEGYNSERNDTNKIAMHPGVATTVGDHGDSVLDQSHRFDAPIALVEITRLN